MGRRSHTRTLGLWMNGTFVGSWRMSPLQGDTLVYDEGWIDSPVGRPLSLSLPFTPGNVPHRGDHVNSYFENLLPDSRVIRTRLARRFGAETTSAFDLLEQIGRDCAGALQIVSGDFQPIARSNIEAIRLSESEVAQLLRRTVSPAVFRVDSDDSDFRISIAGAQEKTALLWHEGAWWQPLGATPTTHILKLPMGLVGNRSLDLTESVENEWLCSLLLRAYGMSVATCHPLRFEDQKVLGVERFDRRWLARDGGQLVRLPQEDMCQATGTPPDRKYEVDGGPGIERIMGLLEGSRNRDADRLHFFQAQVLFWMLCATDGHAKNFSLLMGEAGSYAMAPLYDVLSAYPVVGEGPGKVSAHKVKMAMAVRSRIAHWKVKEIQRRHWVALGRRHGIITPAGQEADAVLDDLIARTPFVVKTVRAQLPEDFPPVLAESIFSGLQSAAQRLASES